MIVTTVNENIIVNEIIVEQSPSEETKDEFFFSLDEWGSITQSEGDSIVFSKDWTNFFSSKLKGLFLEQLQFANVKNCHKFVFIFKKNPFECERCDNLNVKYRVLGSLSEEHLDNETVHSRNLSNSKRFGVETELTEKSVSQYFYNQFNLTRLKVQIWL